MKCGVLERSVWLLFRGSFQRNLSLFHIPQKERKIVMRMANEKYREIIAFIPPFEKNDILRVNIISAAQLASVYLCLKNKPSVELMKEYYEQSMNAVMGRFMRPSNSFSEKYIRKLKSDAQKSQKATNPYTWRYTVEPGANSKSIDAIFDRCGICVLMKELGIPELTNAMCAYDYAMAKLNGTIFTREYTLATGGAVCDCHYRKK